MADDDPGILGEIEDEISSFGDGGDGGGDPPDRDGVYDAVDDVQERVTSVPWPVDEIDPTTRSLTVEEWGIYGEGPPDTFYDFEIMLNSGSIGEVPAEIRPEETPDWGETPMPMARSAQKPRGKHLFAHISATPETMFVVQGHAGANEGIGSTTPEEFVTPLDAKVNEYAERFEDGDRPGKFHAWVDQDGNVQGPQEGRHRAAAAMMAGLEWVPVVVLYDTEGTFQRDELLRSDDGPGYRRRYPGGDA